jgi:hypothetical protein
MFFLKISVIFSDSFSGLFILYRNMCSKIPKPCVVTRLPSTSGVHVQELIPSKTIVREDSIRPIIGSEPLSNTAFLASHRDKIPAPKTFINL